jgi:hypothetical protein
MLRPSRRAAHLSGGKHDGFAAGSGDAADFAQRVKAALTMFEGTFTAVEKSPLALLRGGVRAIFVEIC